ncbi:MAG: PPC domain-containing protein [Verrucomicrobia bacterium]|nr:PPC domain-containing protein [Verrucomicrobiota bacterium]
MRTRIASAIALLSAVILTAQAQQVTPRIAYVYPAGGCRGATFQAVVAGQFLEGTANVLLSGDGIEARVIEHTRPLSVEQAIMLQPKFEELRKKKAAAAGSRTTGAWTAEDEKTLVEMSRKLELFIPKAQINQSIVENVIIEVSIAADAEPGARELRLRGPAGLTNPLVFCVGQLPEFSRPPAKTYRQPKDGKGPKVVPPPSEMSVTLPATVNGQIMPGAANQFRFRARQGQRLVFATSARALIPFLSDASPGWFQAMLALRDAQGKEMAFTEENHVQPDPVAYFQVPKDGDYALEIHDSLYRGREDFVYRITMGETPFVKSIFPLGGPAGAQTTVELNGWNLPQNRLTMDAKGKSPGTVPVAVRKGDLISNRVPFTVSTLPEYLEREPNNTVANAQPVTVPVIVNGRFDRAGDADVFRFEGRAGQEIVAEVVARRLGSPVDSVLKLTDANGNQIAMNDDFEDRGSDLNTHHADSFLRATLPATGTYYVHLRDTQQNGGPDYGYRLRLSRPDPDFELRIVPSGISGRRSATVPITVYALRKEGFTSGIALALRNAPAGFNLSGGRVPAGCDSVRLTLTLPTTTRRGPPESLCLEGCATMHGRELIRAAVPAEDVMQAFKYHHLVPTQDFKVAVMGRGQTAGPMRLLGDSPMRIPVGGMVRVRFDTSAASLPEKLQLELSDPPPGIGIQSSSVSTGSIEIVIECDATVAKAGLQGNLIVNAFEPGFPVISKEKTRGVARRVPLATFPAVAFDVVTSAP